MIPALPPGTVLCDDWGIGWGQLRARLWLEDVKGACAIFSRDGIPLCGRWVEGEEPKLFIAPHWSAREPYPENVT